MNSPRRVLHPITRMIVGGAQLNTLYSCTLADPARYRAEIATGPQTGPEGNLPASPEASGVTVHAIPGLRREVNPLAELQAYRDLAALLRGAAAQGDPFQVVHTHTSKAGILGRLAAHRGRVPAVIHTVHGWQWTQARRGRENGLIVAAERRAARWSDRLIVVAERDREKGLEAGVGTPEQYVHIESAIPLDRFQANPAARAEVRGMLGIPAEAPVAATVGRFAYQKAPEVFLRAALRMLDRMPDAHVVHVGDGPDREQALRAVPQAASHSRLHLMGLREDVPRILGACDLFLLSSRYEGLPRVVVEAYALGLPVVSTPADGVVEVVEDGVTGILTPFGDDAAMAEAAERLLRAPDLRRTMGDRGRDSVRRRFDVRTMVARIQDLYDEVLAGKGSSVTAS